MDVHLGNRNGLKSRLHDILGSSAALSEPQACSVLPGSRGEGVMRRPPPAGGRGRRPSGGAYGFRI